MRIARFTTGDDPAYGLVDGAGEKIAEITGDPLYLRIELTGAVHDIDDVRLLAPVIPRSKVDRHRPQLRRPRQGDGRRGPRRADDVPRPEHRSRRPRRPGRDAAADVARSATRASSPSSSAGCARTSSPRTPSSCVFGYTVANDVTARDLQRSDGQWARAKGFDTFCPLGPWIETDLDPAAQRDHHDARRRGRAGRPDLRHGPRRGHAGLARVARPSRCCPATSSSPARRPASASSSRASGWRSRWTASAC